MDLFRWLYQFSLNKTVQQKHLNTGWLPKAMKKKVQISSWQSPKDEQYTLVHIGIGNHHNEHYLDVPESALYSLVIGKSW